MLESTDKDKSIRCISKEESLYVSKHHFIKAHR